VVIAESGHSLWIFPIATPIFMDCHCFQYPRQEETAGRNDSEVRGNLRATQAKGEEVSATHTLRNVSFQRQLVPRIRRRVF